LTDIMGGELKISSTPGVGSNFTVSLMFSWIENPAAVAFPSRLITGYEERRRVILVVDDEPIHRGLMFDLLNPLGFTTIEARDARTCLDVLREVQPDLFLLDVSMPGMDGLQLAAELREQGYTAPIIMISADAQEHHRNPQTTAHHDDYMVKPINNQKLIERIGQLLGLEWLYSDLPSAPVLPAPKPQTEHLPDHPLLRELLAHAQIGHRSGVTSTLKEIEDAELMEGLLLKKFRDLAARMEYAKLADTLERLLTRLVA
jgi:CheY-like chemotaxis protein